MIGDEFDIDDGFRVDKEKMTSFEMGISIEKLELICTALNGAFLQSRDERYAKLADDFSSLIESEEEEQREQYQLSKLD